MRARRSAPEQRPAVPEALASPDPATTSWVPIWNMGPQSVPVPPVVNGRWLKAVGGAAVWSPGIGLFSGGERGENMQLQVGQGNVSVPAQNGGASTVTVTLAQPWPTTHYAGWVIGLWPLGAWGLSLVGWQPAGLTGIALNFNSPIAQTLSVTWASLGN